MMRFFDTKQKRNCFFVFAFFTIFMMVVIFMFSAQNGDASQATSDGFLAKVLSFVEVLFGGGKFGIWLTDLFTACVRILAHGFIYALLGFFASGSAFCLKCMNSPIKRFVSVMAFCLTYAVTDEIHQIFVPCRSFEFGDIAVDFVGSVVGIFVFLVFFSIIRAIVSRKNKITH